MAERRTLLAVAASVVVAVAVIGVILAFGIRRLPSFPTASADPALEAPGAIAYLAADEEEPCIRVVPAGGGDVRTVRCEAADAELTWIREVAWSPDGEVLAVGSNEVGDDLVLVVDPTTGAVLDRLVREPDMRSPQPEQRVARTRADGAEVVTGGEQGSPRLLVRSPLGGTRTLIDVDGPRDYRFVDAQWSPDGEWVVVLDSEGRLLVVGSEGDPGPRRLVEDAQARGGAVAWFISGDETYTTDPADLVGGS